MNMTLRAGKTVKAQQKSWRRATLVTRVSLVAAFALVLGSLHPTDASAKKQLSDKAVNYLMNLTWAIMPDKIKGKGGKEIPIDKNKRTGTQVPLEDARRVILVARLSAHAQICKLPELQKKNYRTMMKLEMRKKVWSRKQVVYLNQLHLFTVMWLTGNVSIAEDDGKADKKDGKKKKVPTCSKQERIKVKAKIEKYLKDNPLPKKTAKKTGK